MLAETMRLERLLRKTSKSNKLIKGGLKVIISRSAAFASKILVGRHLTFVMDFLLREHRPALDLQDLKIFVKNKLLRCLGKAVKFLGLFTASDEATTSSQNQLLCPFTANF